MKGINRWIWNKLESTEKETLLSRSGMDISDVLEIVKAIIEDVKLNRDNALFRYAKKFDGADLIAAGISLKVTEKEFDDAEKILPLELKESLAYCIENVKTFHRKQLPNSVDIIESFEIRPGIFVGEKITPIDSVGLYVPRGRGSFPSMLYMLAVPAVEAGVNRVCVVTPPNKDCTVDAGCLYAARLCGVKEVYRTGGAQAIAALTFGTESLPRVVKTTGPGSIFVAAARQLLYGKIDTGLPAGPSESMVLADSSADPYKAALDLLTEAEHGADSAAILVTDSQNLADEAAKYIIDIIENAPEPRKTFLSKVFSKGGYGGIIITSSVEEGVEVVNLYAPEHLQIATANPEKIALGICNAGEILLGQNTPFSIANYATGPNAVLPTGGMAKTFSPVSVRDFMKSSSIIKADVKGLAEVSPHAIALADYEGFYTHGEALKRRKGTE